MEDFPFLASQFVCSLFSYVIFGQKLCHLFTDFYPSNFYLRMRQIKKIFQTTFCYSQIDGKMHYNIIECLAFFSKEIISE